MGAVDDMAMNPTCSLVSVICRGNWQLSGDCVAFLYLTYKLHVNSGGCALAGFQDRKRKGCSPNLNVIKNSSNCDTLGAVIEELFGCLGIKELQKNGRLHTFWEVMLASLLEYFEMVA